MNCPTRRAASIFSWTAGIIRLVAELILIISYSASFWFVILWLLDCAFVIIILIWRQQSVTVQASKVLCGIFTFIFVSALGGILTLCIPESEMRTRSTTPINRNALYGTNTKKLTQKEFDEKLKILDMLLKKGTISKAEYDKRVLNYKSQTANSSTSFQKKQVPVRNSEQETIRLISEYKKLLDNGAITQAEFDAKKQSLLNNK